jgi:hypothetical protein
MEKLTKDEALGKIGGSSLKGYIFCKYADLINLFGTPTFDTPSGDDKVQFEWVIEYEGDVFTIYDWKTYDRRYSIEELNQWNVGGKVYAGDFTTMVENKIKEINKVA